MSKKRNALTLRHRIALIHEAESGKSCRQLVDQFKIGRTQATSIIKRKADLLLEYDQNNSLDRKRKLQKTGNEDVNIICWEWFQTARAQNIPLSGPMLQEKALSYAKELGNAEYKASNGWLESFRKRHNIAFNVISGEAADVSSETIDDWKKRIPSIIDGYALEDIYNCDETGLFYRALPDRTLSIKGQHCQGGKRSK